jgi:hypothetical protein
VIVHDFGGEALGVALHALHERRALQSLDIARPVVDLGGRHELSAFLHAGDQQRRAIGARRINCGAVARGSGAQDDEATVPGGRHGVHGTKPYNGSRLS